MKSYKTALFLGIFLAIGGLSYGQVGVDNTDPDPSSLLDLNATDKGLLIPRMTTAQREAIVSPATSLLVFDTTLNLYFYFFNSQWHALNPWQPSASSSDIYYNSGNVGIGTPEPRGKFDVDGPGDIYLVDDPIAGSSQSFFIPGHVFLSTYGATNTSFIQARREDDSGTTALQLRTWNNGSLTEGIRIEGNGNVGIGTTTPAVRLHVNGSIRGNVSGGAIRVGTEYGYVDIGPRNGSWSHFETDRPAFYFNRPVYVDGAINSYQPDLRLGTNGTERITVLGANGNVGIGKTSPAYKLDVNGPTNVTELYINGVPLSSSGGIPPGGIIMWSGSIASIPSGWALCNGSNGTPNLQDRFIVGAGSSYSPGNTGGQAQVTLTVSQIPAHTHTDRRLSSFSGSTVGYGGATGTMGGNYPSGSTGSGQAHENRPPYYALAYIMKLP